MRLIFGRQHLAELLEHAPLVARQLLGNAHRQVNVEIAAAAGVQVRNAQIPSGAGAGPAASLPGIFTVCRPSKVSISTDAPSAACAMLIGTVQCRSSSWRSKMGCSATFSTTYRSPGGPPFAAGLAFLREAQLRAVVDAGRNVDLQLALAAQIAFAAALLAGTADDLAAPAALRAGAAHGKKRLLVNHFAAAAADGAGDQAVFGLGAFAFAAPALFQARNLNVDGQAAHGVFEADLQVVADIFAALGAGAPLLARSARRTRRRIRTRR